MKLLMVGANSAAWSRGLAAWNSMVASANQDPTRGRGDVLTRMERKISWGGTRWSRVWSFDQLVV